MPFESVPLLAEVIIMLVAIKQLRILLACSLTRSLFAGGGCRTKGDGAARLQTNTFRQCIHCCSHTLQLAVLPNKKLRYRCVHIDCIYRILSAAPEKLINCRSL